MKEDWENQSREELIALVKSLRDDKQYLQQELSDNKNCLHSIGKLYQIYWWYQDIESGKEFFSDNWQSLIGKSCKNFSDFLPHVHLHDRQKLLIYKKDLTSDGDAVTCCFRVTTQHGDLRYIEATILRTGKKIFKFLQDVSEINHYKSSFKKADDIYKQVVNLQDELICRFKLDTTLTFVNKAYADFLQKSEEELIGKKFLSFLPEDLHDRALKQHQKALQGMQDPGSNIQRLEMHGKVYWHRWKDYPIYDEAGKLVEIQSVGIDITDKLLMQRKLEASERKYRLLTESSKDLIFAFDKNLTLTYVNAATEEILGYTAAEFVSLSFEDYTCPENHHIITDTIEEIRKDCLNDVLKDKYIKKLSLLHKDGYQVYLEAVIGPIVDASGKFYGTVGISRDINERLDYENKLIAANSTLSQLVEEKNKFLSTVSHELKSPLNAILGMTDLLKKGLAPIPYEEILDTIHFSTEHLNTLINNLLDLSKLQHHHIQLEETNFDVIDLFRKIINYYRIEAEDKKLVFYFEYPQGSDIHVVGDSNRLTQIIHNIISNAIKFTESGFVKVVLREIARDQNASTVNIEVADSGIGIPEEQQERVFEPFVRGKSVHSKKILGSGIGLAVVKELIELHRGRLYLESREGRGTRISVTIPFKISNEKRRTASLSVIKNLKDLNVLYVEDLEYNQKLMDAYARYWGLELCMASTAEEGLSLLKNEVFDLILMDIMLPGLQGNEAAQKIRELERKGNIPPGQIIIALTAQSNNGDHQYLKDHGFNDILEKPITPDLLMKILNKWLVGGTVCHKNDHILSPGQDEDLFQNLRSGFQWKRSGYKNVLLSFSRDFDHQKEVFSEAITQHDNTKYKKFRHHMLAMLAMLNESVLRDMLDHHHYLPQSSGDIQELRKTISMKIESLQKKMAKELESLS